MNASEYKKYHESFMQNNHGSTALHTFFCIFFTVQCAIYITIKPKNSPLYQYVYEYLVIVLSMILSHTILAEHIYILNLSVFIILLYELKFHIPKASKTLMLNNSIRNNRIPFVTTLRGLTYIITVLAILAVDFQDFPRYLAKTERFGYSLMDTGAALFVLMSGLVHKDLCRDNHSKLIKGNMKVITVLLFLGVGRFLSVKQLDYQEHVTEYGVHWNFFFTIAVSKFLSTLLLFIFNKAFLCSIIILIFYEYLLYAGLQEWVLSEAPRNSLISANREGISSCLGYVSLYLFAASLKQTLLTKNVTRIHIQKQLVLGTVFLWILSSITNIVRPASRTLANASYCIYMDTVLVTVTSVMYFVSVLFDDKYETQDPFILSAINTNGLSYFLIANLMTGAVNLSIRTLLVSSVITFIILNIYMTLTIVLIVWVKRLGFKV